MAPNSIMGRPTRPTTGRQARLVRRRGGPARRKRISCARRNHRNTINRKRNKRPRRTRHRTRRMDTNNHRQHPRGRTSRRHPRRMRANRRTQLKRTPTRPANNMDTGSVRRPSRHRRHNTSHNQRILVSRVHQRVRTSRRRLGATSGGTRHRRPRAKIQANFTRNFKRHLVVTRNQRQFILRRTRRQRSRHSRRTRRRRYYKPTRPTSRTRNTKRRNRLARQANNTNGTRTRTTFFQQRNTTSRTRSRQRQDTKRASTSRRTNTRQRHRYQIKGTRTSRPYHM